MFPMVAMELRRLDIFQQSPQSPQRGSNWRRQIWRVLDDTNICLQLSKQRGGGGGRWFHRSLKLRQEIGLKTLNSRKPLGVIIERNRPALKPRGLILPPAENLALLGLSVLTDIWVDWDATDVIREFSGID